MNKVIQYRFWLILFCAVVMFSCSKDKEVLVEGNVVPPDETIENLTISNYVQKLYISLLGRKPTDIEKERGVQALKVAELSEEGRNDLMGEIIMNAEYYDNEFAIMRADYLNGADSADFADAKELMEFAKTLTNNPLEIAYYDDHLQRILPLISLEDDLGTGVVTVDSAHKLLVHNYIYDEINMGSENYVVSLFQNFLYRYPTAAELEAGKEMYADKPAILFATSAKNREGLIDLFFDHMEYYQGQVRANYLRFLYREPTGAEIKRLANEYKTTGDYKLIQKYILSLDEYVGIK